MKSKNITNDRATDADDQPKQRSPEQKARDALSNVPQDLTVIWEEQEQVYSTFEGLKPLIKDIMEGVVSEEEEITSCISMLEQKVGAVKAIDKKIDLILAKFDADEFQATKFKIEICNLPERSEENLLVIFKNITNLLKVPMSSSDVIAIHRFPEMDPAITKKGPQNVLVTLSSQMLRDNILAQMSLRKRITTKDIKLSGKQRKIYINEHLTLRKKILLRQTKEVAKENGCKVSIKEATILVHADITQPGLAIRSEEDLRKIKPRTESQ